jgi:hypothetical protein
MYSSCLIVVQILMSVALLWLLASAQASPLAANRGLFALPVFAIAAKFATITWRHFAEEKRNPQLVLDLLSTVDTVCAIVAISVIGQVLPLQDPRLLVPVCFAGVFAALILADRFLGVAIMTMSDA